MTGFGRSLFGSKSVWKEKSFQNTDLLRWQNTDLLRWAVHTNDIYQARILLKNGADPNGQSRFSTKDKVLKVASIHGNLNLCQLLVSYGATIDDIDNEGRTALSEAVFFDNLALTTYLLKNGANPNALGFVRNETVLHYAARNGYLNMSQLLVSKGATIDALDSLKCTPLYLAVTGNHIDVISYLLFKGANPNAESESHAGRESVLHVAVGNYNLKICQLLVSNGATIDPRNSWQYTPLCLAVRRNDITVTSYLLENGANPNVDTYHYDDQVKESVLHIAARNSNFDICQLLISKGADVNCLTSNNETALMIALNNILLHKVHHLSNIAIVIIEYLLKNEAICISKKVGDVKDKYRKIFKQVFASNLYFQKINMWYRIMCKITSRDDGSLKSSCRDVIWKNGNYAKISDTVKLNIPDCLRKYLIYEEERKCF
ncbi:putative ankyrin repeat protein RF_0381 [Artemia franciscana]